MLKALMFRKKLDDAKKLLDEARAKREDFKTREAELEQAIYEASTEEEQQTVEAAISDFETEKAANKAEINNLSAQVEELERQLKETEAKANTATTEPADGEARARKELPIVENIAITTTRARKIFGKMDAQTRTAMFEREDVKAFLTEIRTCIKEKRALTNVGVLVPEVYLGLIRENIVSYSKLYKYAYVRSIKGNGRTTIMGTIPEAVWTEMCATLNELDLSFYSVEVDGYKVGGFIPVCNATLEDSDIDLAAEIIATLGQAIGLALDKAIIYGVGTKMPLGIITRLAQESAPENYPEDRRPWEDLHAKNIKTIRADITGIEFYKDIVRASGAAKGKYSRGQKVWVMNDATYTDLKAEMLTINAAGAVVSGIESTLPVVGGKVETLEFMPDNVIIGGYFDNYLLAERSGVKLGQSEHYKFVEDETVFKGTARYDGLPVIPEAFVAIGIRGTTPSPNDVTFAKDIANPDGGVGTLASLVISDAELSPEFAAGTTTYTATASKAKATITATPSDKFDQIAISFNGAYIPNGGQITWASGSSNVVTVDVKDSETGAVTSYTVTVTAS